MSIVGRALESRLNCEPHSNFNPKYGSLEGAKFQLQPVKPAGTPFEKDFEKAFNDLTKVQGQAASTQDCRNFIVTEAGNNNFRFGEHVFEKGSATPLDIDGGELVDETTENWPILVDFHADLENIKPEYRAMPLSVFRNDAFVRPEQVRDIVKGALVEVHFELHHYHICNKGYNSFNGSIEQIIVLQPSDIQPISAYKRKNVEEGPIRLKPSLVLQMGSQSIAKPGVGRPKTAPLEQGMQPVPGPSTRIVEQAQVEARVQPDECKLSQSLPGIIDKGTDR
ncbi:hypothetical protein EDB84DRAFT_1265624 [Lactarius hengduanensis]|nr:hypothetical protein EDB84DRAFT_1265624 [Lactarius hengduanensis]